MGWRSCVLLSGILLALFSWLLRQEDRVLRARIWRPSSPGFGFPEVTEPGSLRDYLLQRENFGIAIAGGGTRGMAIAHGAVRTLREAGILQRARYMSVTSGSVWFGVPLYYQQAENLDALLGQSLSPEDLTPEVLTDSRSGSFFQRLTFFRRYPKGMEEEPEPSHGTDPSLRGQNQSTAQREHAQRRDAEAKWGAPVGSLNVLDCWHDLDPCTCLARVLLPDTSLRELWNLVTNYVFLHPFGLAEPFSSHCHETQEARTRKRLGNSSTIYTARDASQQLPFLLSQSAILAPYTPAGESVAAFPLEQSPLYAGTPGSYEGKAAEPYEAVGDVLVEAYAWPGEAVKLLGATGNSEVDVRREPRLFNTGQLGEWASIATSYAADFQVRTWSTKIPQCVIALVEMIMPHAPIWSPLSLSGHGGQPTTNNLAVGDAGIYDDLGHLPLLRRGVRKMVIYDSSAVHDNETGTDRENICEMVYTRAAFGQPGCLDPPAAAGASNPRMVAGFNTVFEPSEFQPFWAKVVALYKAREPVVVRGNFTVLDNKFLGIKGGFQAEIIWVIGLPIEAWRSRLPAKSREYLLEYFPNYLASEMKSRFEMGALSQYASWLTQQAVLKEVRSMLGDQPATLNTDSETEVVV